MSEGKDRFRFFAWLPMCFYRNLAEQNSAGCTTEGAQRSTSEPAIAYMSPKTSTTHLCLCFRQRSVFCEGCFSKLWARESPKNWWNMSKQTWGHHDHAESMRNTHMNTDTRPQQNYKHKHPPHNCWDLHSKWHKKQQQNPNYLNNDCEKNPHKNENQQTRE